MPLGIARDPPADRRAAAGLGRQLRADGLRQGAVMAVPAHDERDFEFAQTYGLRIHQVIQPRGRLARRHRRRGLCRARHADQLGPVRRPRLRRGGRRDREAVRSAGPRQAARASSACATGASRASATGAARSRSSIAPTAASCRCRTTSCRSCCRRTWCRTAAATRSARTRPSSSARARSAASRRGARRTRWTRSSIRRWYFLRYASADNDRGHGRRARQLLAAGGPVHRRHRARHPAPAVLALLDAGDARPGPAQVDEPFANLLTQGMVLNEIYFRKPAEGRIVSTSIPPTWTWSSTTRARAVGAVAAAPTASRSRCGRHRHDVQVEEQRRGPAGAGASSTAPTRRGCS